MTRLAQKRIIDAWRDDDYFESLSDEEKQLVPESPAGPVRLGLVRAEHGEAAETYQGHCATFISNTCDTFISGCCSTLISNTCDTFITTCCGRNDDFEGYPEER